MSKFELGSGVADDLRAIHVEHHYVFYRVREEKKPLMLPCYMSAWTW
jgi:hypothetical protein